MVDVFEASMVLLLHALGVSLLNDSPPCSIGGSRFFEPTGNRAAQLHGCVTRWIKSMNGPASVARMMVCDVKPPWLRRALMATEMLLTSGAFALPGGARVQPLLALRDGRLTFNALQCAEALMSGDAEHERVVAAWCRGCSCPARVRLCACLALVEARKGTLRRAPQVLSLVMALLRPTAALVQAAECAPDLLHAGVTAASAAAAPVYADTFGDAATMTAVAATLLGGGAGWALEGSAARSAALMRYINAARGLFAEAWKEAATTSKGGAVDRRRSTTAAQVEASRGRASATTVVATAPTSAEGMLRHLLRRSGGAAAAIGGGSGAAGALSLVDGGRLISDMLESMRALDARTVVGGAGAGEGGAETWNEGIDSTSAAAGEMIVEDAGEHGTTGIEGRLGEAPVGEAVAEYEEEEATARASSAAAAAAQSSR